MIPVARNTGSSPGSEAGFVRFSPMRALLCHGGLTPPAPGAVTTAVCRNNDDFCDAQTHIRKSGGRQPAVGVSNAVAIASALVQCHARQPAVACKPHLQRQCGEFGRFEYACGRYSTGGLRPPLLVACTDAVADGRFSPRRAIVSHGGLTPPAPGRTCRRRCRWAILADESDSLPTGGLRPPLLALLQRPSAGITTIFAMHKRISTRAAGVSPPWV
jgi:hypothetical protein